MGGRSRGRGCGNKIRPSTPTSDRSRRGRVGRVVGGTIKNVFNRRRRRVK